MARRTGDSFIDGLIEQEEEAVAQELKQAIQGYVGVDTGALRDSITIEKESDSISVGVDEDALVADSRNYRARNYARFHHDGTIRTRANPFLDKALNDVGRG